MKIYHAIEELSFLQEHISDSDRKEIIESYSVEQWVRAATYFLNGLPNTHQVIGKTIGTMRGICQDYREHETITWRQLWFLVSNLIENWQEISYEYRGFVVV